MLLFSLVWGRLFFSPTVNTCSLLLLAPLNLLSLGRLVTDFKKTSESQNEFFMSNYFQIKKVFSSKNLVSLANRVRSSEAAVSFLKENGILHSRTKCSSCLTELTQMHRKPGSAYWYFHCVPCKAKVSIRNKTILSHSKIGLRTFIMMA